MKKLKIKNRAQRVLFAYETEKIVQINSKRIGFIYRLLQILILTYIIGYVMIYMNGYQEFFGITSSVVTKVKGVSSVEHRRDIFRKIWDVADAVIPVEERKALFITTNAVVTLNQTQTTCAESYDVEEARCSNNEDCIKDHVYILGNGVGTGRCLSNNQKSKQKTCEIKAWCPVEDDTLVGKRKPMLQNVLNFTLFIRNMVQFDQVQVKRSNLFLWDNKKIPKNCRYNAKDPLLKYCPIFKISSIVGDINEKEKAKLLRYGGVYQVIINWDCNLNIDPKYCKPEFSFNRLDHPSAVKSNGWNFRYPIYFDNDNKQYRNLYKVFGLRILVEVRGKASKFSFIVFSMNLGSGLSYFAVAVVICDFIILYLMPNRNSYSDIKFETHNDDDAFEGSDFGSTVDLQK